LAYSVYSTFQNDSLPVGSKIAGVSVMCGYTVNVGSWSSLAIIDARHAVDGNRVELIWGDADTSLRPLATERHIMTTIRATVSTRALV
jgi:hypothetical protein